MTFALPLAEPLDPESPPQPGALWLGRLDGVLVGVTTRPIVPLPGFDPSTEDARRLHHIGGVQSVLADARLESITGVAPSASVDTVFDEIQDAAFSAVELQIDGHPTTADALAYRGLDFAFGRDLIRQPLVVIKQSGAGPWPEVCFTG